MLTTRKEVNTVVYFCYFQGMTALHWACSKGHLDAVKLLFEFRVFPNHMEITEDRYQFL